MRSPFRERPATRGIDLLNYGRCASTTARSRSWRGLTRTAAGCRSRSLAHRPAEARNAFVDVRHLVVREAQAQALLQCAARRAGDAGHEGGAGRLGRGLVIRGAAAV